MPGAKVKIVQIVICNSNIVFHNFIPIIKYKPNYHFLNKLVSVDFCTLWSLFRNYHQSVKMICKTSLLHLLSCAVKLAQRPSTNGMIQVLHHTGSVVSYSFWNWAIAFDCWLTSKTWLKKCRCNNLNPPYMDIHT